MAWSILRRWRQRRITVEAFSAVHREYLCSLAIKAKTRQNREQCLRYVVEHLGAMPMIDVRPSHIARMVADIYDSGRRVTARRVLLEADALFYRAVLEDVLSSNPAAAVKPPHAPPARARLRWEEWLAIHDWAVMRGRLWFVCALRLALITGQRRSDLVRMRMDHIADGHLRIEQHKTGARIALPLDLRLDALGATLGDAIQDCMDYRRSGQYLLRKTGDRPLDPGSLSMRFAEARQAALPDADWSPRTPPTLHEIRSLSERLYRAQGIDTMTLLGHKRQHMTDQYNDDRGLSAGDWRQLRL